MNVAGIIQPFVRLNDLDYDAIERVIDVNLYGTIHTVKAFLPHLLTRPVATHRQRVQHGRLPARPRPDDLRREQGRGAADDRGAVRRAARDTPVGVTVVFPGAVHTDISGNSGVPTPGGDAAAQESRFPMTEPDAAARTIVDGIEGDRFHVFVGRDSRLLDLLVRLVPRSRRPTSSPGRCGACSR